MVWSSHEEGHQEGYRKGREEGREKGHQTGRQDEKIEVIQKAFHGGVPIETIVLLTGMEVEDIMRVKQELKLA